MQQPALENFLRKKTASGLGLFTKIPFTKGDFVLEYTGEKISDAEADRRGGRYLFRLNKDWLLDGKDRSHLGRYLNHSCRPNCYAEIDENEEHIYFYAKKKIRAGEELTFNYGKEYWREYIEPYGCKCATCLANTGRPN